MNTEQFLSFSIRLSETQSDLLDDCDWLADQLKGPLRGDFRRFIQGANGSDEFEQQECSRFLTKIWIHCRKEAERRLISE